jgi:chemotaxis protein MotB
MEIGPSLRSRYPSNWELSKARASGVVRYLIEKGGIDSVRLSSVGYGDSKPLMTNMNEDGRSRNRRVEVLLYAPSADEGSTKPEMPESAGTPPEPAGLTAKGGEGSAAPAGAADVTPSSNAPSSGQEPALTPAAEAADAVPVPDSMASETNAPVAPSVDGPVPATLPDK